MNNSHMCQICGHTYKYEKNFLKHLNVHTHITTPKKLNKKLTHQDLYVSCENSTTNKYICEHCNREYKHHQSYYRHLKKCPIATGKYFPEELKTLFKEHQEMKEKISNIEKDHSLQTEKINNIEKDPKQINNVLQVFCVGPKDNYLDMLTESWGFERAIEYVKDCALSNLTGDIKLIEKIYFDGKDPHDYPIKIHDKKRCNLSFVDENNEKIIDQKGSKLAQRLSNNLQNSYLKGVNYLINRNIENRLCPNKFLEEYDIQSWNQHIYDLSDFRRQKQVIQQLIINHSKDS